MTDNIAFEIALYGESSSVFDSFGKEYTICADHLHIIRVIRFMMNGDTDSAVKLFFEGYESVPEDAADIMRSFIGEKYLAFGKMPYSFYDDYGLIASAFLQCYGIDLLETDMHWHRFIVYFNGLSCDTSFSGLVALRMSEELTAGERLILKRMNGGSL